MTLAPRKRRCRKTQTRALRLEPRDGWTGNATLQGATRTHARPSASLRVFCGATSAFYVHEERPLHWPPSRSANSTLTCVSPL